MGDNTVEISCLPFHSLFIYRCIHPFDGDVCLLNLCQGLFQQTEIRPGSLLVSKSAFSDKFLLLLCVS